MAVQKNKLWLKGIFPERSDDEIRRFCDQYGKSVHMARPTHRDYIFLTYLTEEEALQAQAKFIQSRYVCRFAKLPRTSYDSDTTSNSSPTNSAASTDPESSTTTSPGRNARRVRFSPDVVTTSPPTSSSQQSNGTARSNAMSTPAQPPPKIVFRNNDKIIISYVQSASTFYAHQVSKDKQRHELIRKISQLAKRIDCVKEPPKFMALAPYQQGYYRAIIKSPASDVHASVLVTLVDIGISFDVRCDELKPIPSEYMAIKISNRFILDGVDDEPRESYAAKCLRVYICKELIMKCDDESVGRLSSVRLIDPDTNQCINDQIKEMQQSFDEEVLVHVPAPLGRNKQLITVDESNLADGENIITLLDANNLPEFMEQKKCIQAVGNAVDKFPPYMPKEGEVCLVLYSGQWNRAVLIKSTSSKVADVESEAEGATASAAAADTDGDDTLVMLMDLCKGVIIKSKYIRHITNELVHMSILPFAAEINGYDQPIDKAKVADLLQKFKPMTMTSVKLICESSDSKMCTIDI